MHERARACRVSHHGVFSTNVLNGTPAPMLHIGRKKAPSDSCVAWRLARDRRKLGSERSTNPIYSATCERACLQTDSLRSRRVGQQRILSASASVSVFSSRMSYPAASTIQILFCPKRDIQSGKKRYPLLHSSGVLPLWERAGHIPPSIRYAAVFIWLANREPAPSKPLFDLIDARSDHCHRVNPKAFFGELYGEPLMLALLVAA